MRELNSCEIENVGGGIIPVLVALGFVWYEAGHIEDFANGFLDGANR